MLAMLEPEANFKFNLESGRINAVGMMIPSQTPNEFDTFQQNTARHGSKSTQILNSVPWLQLDTLEPMGALRRCCLVSMGRLFYSTSWMSQLFMKM
jgi:hypothetical protein